MLVEPDLSAGWDDVKSPGSWELEPSLSLWIGGQRLQWASFAWWRWESDTYDLGAAGSLTWIAWRNGSDRASLGLTGSASRELARYAGLRASWRRSGPIDLLARIEGRWRQDPSYTAWRTTVEADTGSLSWERWQGLARLRAVWRGRVWSPGVRFDLDGRRGLSRDVWIVGAGDDDVDDQLKKAVRTSLQATPALSLDARLSAALSLDADLSWTWQSLGQDDHPLDQTDDHGLAGRLGGEWTW